MLPPPLRAGAKSLIPPSIEGGNKKGGCRRQSPMSSKPRKIGIRLPLVSGEMRCLALELRRKMTQPERRLWLFLDRGQLGVKFLRQRAIGNFIVDFVSLEAGLIVEVDGSQHYTDDAKVKDRQRDEFLTSLGFKVIRFSDLEVMRNHVEVVEEIKRQI